MDVKGGGHGVDKTLSSIFRKGFVYSLHAQAYIEIHKSFANTPQIIDAQMFLIIIIIALLLVAGQLSGALLLKEPMPWQDLHFATCFVDMPSLRVLAGNMHWLRLQDGQHPTLHVFIDPTDKGIIDSQEVSGWNKVVVHSTSNYPFDCKQKNNLANIRMILDQVEKPAIWLKGGDVLMPGNASEIREAEKWMEPVNLRKAFLDGQCSLRDTFWAAMLKFKNIQVVNDEEDDGGILLLGQLQNNNPSNTSEKHDDQHYEEVDGKSFLAPIEAKQSCYIQTSASVIPEWLESPMSHPVHSNVEELDREKHWVAVGVPTTSKGILNTLADQQIIKTLLPGLLKSTSLNELHVHPIVLMIGFDDCDGFFEAHHDQCFQYLTESIKKNGRSGLIAVEMYRMPRIKRVAQLWNALFAKAMLSKSVQYFYQLNDDVTLETSGWLEAFIEALDRVNGPEVVGPADPHNGLACRILTQAMVTRRHNAAKSSSSFLLYPLAFKDWKCDRWLTYAYGRAKAQCFPGIIARNGNAGDGKCRYQQCDMPRWRMEL